MFDKIWEFFTSDDRLDKLLTRTALIVFLILIYVLATNMTVALLIVLGLIIIGAVTVALVMRNADKKAEAEWQRLLNEEDDGETGYIAVRPEELEGVPWEKRPPAKSQTLNQALQAQNTEPAQKPSDNQGDNPSRQKQED